MSVGPLLCMHCAMKSSFISITSLFFIRFHLYHTPRRDTASRCVLLYSHSELDLRNRVVLRPVSFSFVPPPFSVLFFTSIFFSVWVWLLELIRYSESVFFLPVRGQQLVVENLNPPIYRRYPFCPLHRPLSEIREGASQSGEMAGQTN